MNIQDILHKGGTRLDAVLDNSELYDYQLCESIICELVTTLDISELYDYELINNVLGKLDMVLDSSEFYDYALGDNTIDYIYRSVFVGGCKYLLTEDNYVLTTHDNFYLQYH